MCIRDRAWIWHEHRVNMAPHVVIRLQETTCGAMSRGRTILKPSKILEFPEVDGIALNPLAVSNCLAHPLYTRTVIISKKSTTARGGG